MFNTGNGLNPAAGAVRPDDPNEERSRNALLKPAALHNAILTSANFSIIATDERGIIQVFNGGAERMLGYACAEVVNRISPSDIHDPQEVIAHAQAVSLEFATPVAPGFEALVFKASRGIDDTYELTYIRKDGSRFPALLSVSALRDEDGQIIGYLLIGTDITRRKVAEEDLRNNEWRLRYATESARLTYVEADLVRGAARTPENFASVMGYAPPPEQEADISVGTRLLLEHVVPQDRPRVIAAHEEFLAGTPSGKVDYRVLGDDHVERWIETRWSVEFARDGKPLKSFATNLDITERKHAEQKIRESEERYRTLFNSMDEGYCVLEMIFDEHEKPVDYRFLEVNSAFEEQSGMHDATGKRIRELVPDIEEHWLETYGKVVLTGEAIRYVNEAKTMDASWFDVNAFRLGGPESRKVAVLFRNIKERKDAENALRESEERYRTLFTSIDEGFCVIEMIFDEHDKPVDYIFLEVNPTFGKQTGLLEATGKRMRELVPDLEEHWFEIYGNVALTGESIRFMNEAKPMEGRWFDVYACRVGGPDSRKVAIIFNDITKRKAIDLSLNNAMAVAEKANRAKTDFLSSMSHELRTPLGAILGFAQLMDSASPPATTAQKRSIDQILQAGWYLLEMINEILDLALIESGKLLLSLEPISLAEVMRECQTMIEPQAQKRDISLVFPSFERAYFVQADRTRLKQVLINLLSNAIKYNKVGGAIVVDCIASTAQRIRIGVADTGAGLRPEEIAQLFQPFNRIGQEASAEEGTGIGLVVCKRLVELMKGEIGVESAVGKGSVFWIELNLAAEPQLAAFTAEFTVVAPEQVHADALLRTVLYVEDNPANLMLIEDLLACRSDIRLLSAADGRRGIEIALASRPDVILMDINLPGISGIQALEILRDIPATAHIPVIALTANAMPRDIEKGLAAGFFRYLTKPIIVNEFMETLDVALKFSITDSARPN